MKIPVINGLRGLAIIAVLYTHLFGKRPVFDASHIGWLPLHGIPALETNLYRAVQLFFIISGFVLALPYFTGRRHMIRGSDIVDFYKRRAKRLLPLYFFSVLIGMAFVYPHELTKGIPLMFTATFIFDKEMFSPPYNTILWSLGIEIWACIFLPFILLGIRKTGVLRMLIILVCMGLLIRGAPHVWEWAAGFQGKYRMIENSVFGRMEDFMWGIALSAVYVRTTYFKNMGWAFCGILLLFLSLNLSDAVQLHTVMPVLTPLVHTLFNMSFFMVMAPLLQQPRSWPTTILSFRPLQMIGLMSYSLYVWHFMVQTSMQPWINTEHLIRYILILFGISWLSYRYIEFGNVENVRALLPQKKVSSMQ